MLAMNDPYHVYPSLEQELLMVSWLEMCRGVYNYALGEVFEYIIGAEVPYPDDYKQQNALTAIKAKLPHLKDVQSQAIQEPLRRGDLAFVAMKARGHGFSRFKRFGQYRSFLFPQFRSWVRSCEAHIVITESASGDVTNFSFQNLLFQQKMAQKIKENHITTRDRREL
jgi:putative transposase